MKDEWTTVFRKESYTVNYKTLLTVHTGLTSALQSLAFIWLFKARLILTAQIADALLRQVQI